MNEIIEPNNDIIILTTAAHVLLVLLQIMNKINSKNVVCFSDADIHTADHMPHLSLRYKIYNLDVI